MERNGFSAATSTSCIGILSILLLCQAAEVTSTGNITTSMFDHNSTSNATVPSLSNSTFDTNFSSSDMNRSSTTYASDANSFKNLNLDSSNGTVTSTLSTFSTVNSTITNENYTKSITSSEPITTSPEIDIQTLPLADHVLQTELELINNNNSSLNATEFQNMTLLLVRNGNAIVAAPSSALTHYNFTETYWNTTFENGSLAGDELEIVNDTGEGHSGTEMSTVHPANSTIDRLESFTITQSAILGELGGSSFSSSLSISTFQSTGGIETTTANLTDLLDRATIRQFCKFPLPSLEQTPRCSWKSTSGHQMDFWPTHIDVSLCIAFVDKLEQCQILCENQHDQCHGVDFCSPCVDYNCRLFKEAPGGLSGLRLSNALTFVDFHEKITCANDGSFS